MAHFVDKKTGRITFSGWEQGIAPSPYKGVGDIKGANISSITGEVSVAYNRARQDNVPVSAGTFTTSGTHVFAYSATNLTNGTWIQCTATTGTTGLTVGNYYFCVVNVAGSSYKLYSDMGVTQITGDSGSGTVTFSTLNMGIAMDYAVEQSASGSTYRYYIIDQNGIIWANGTTASIATSFIAGGITSSTTWQAITPYGSSTNAVDTFNSNAGSIQIMYATNSNNKIQASYLMIFTLGQIKQGTNSSGWPSVSGTPFAVWQSLNYSDASSHKSILGNDQVIYFCDGPGIGIIQQKTGQQFNPATPSTYNYVNANYLMAPTDTATRIAMIPSGNGLSIVVGGQQNNLYVYPSYQNSTASGAAPTTLLWMPESNTQFLLATNNYILVFPGSKGNIYLTNGSSVVPIMTVPDYIAGSANFVQDPYFVWGGAMYLRGRVFFSIKDQSSSHTGNCGGIWSFAPSFSYFVNQDTGLALRMEGASSQFATSITQGTIGFNGYAPVIFAGQETTAQQNDGPQYIACWSQGNNDGSGIVNSIDFSGTSPLTNSSTIIETDVVPVGTFLEPKTFTQIEVQLGANLVTGESITVNYRTDLEAAWASAGTVVSEPAITGNGSPLSRLIQGLNFQKVQLIQLQLVLNSTATNPSWCRVRDISII